MLLATLIDIIDFLNSNFCINFTGPFKIRFFKLAFLFLNLNFFTFEFDILFFKHILLIFFFIRIKILVVLVVRLATKVFAHENAFFRW